MAFGKEHPQRIPAFIEPGTRPVAFPHLAATGGQREGGNVLVVPKGFDIKTQQVVDFLTKGKQPNLSQSISTDEIS